MFDSTSNSESNGIKYEYHYHNTGPDRTNVAVGALCVLGVGKLAYEYGQIKKEAEVTQQRMLEYKCQRDQILIENMQIKEERKVGNDALLNAPGIRQGKHDEDPT